MLVDAVEALWSVAGLAVALDDPLVVLARALVTLIEHLHLLLLTRLVKFLLFFHFCWLLFAFEDISDLALVLSHDLVGVLLQEDKHATLVDIERVLSWNALPLSEATVTLLRVIATGLVLVFVAVVVDRLSVVGGAVLAVHLMVVVEVNLPGSDVVLSAEHAQGLVRETIVHSLPRYLLNVVVVVVALLCHHKLMLILLMLLVLGVGSG